VGDNKYNLSMVFKCYDVYGVYWRYVTGGRKAIKCELVKKVLNDTTKPCHNKSFFRVIFLYIYLQNFNIARKMKAL